MWGGGPCAHGPPRVCGGHQAQLTRHHSGGAKRAPRSRCACASPDLWATAKFAGLGEEFVKVREFTFEPCVCRGGLAAKPLAGVQKDTVFTSLCSQFVKVSSSLRCLQLR